MNITYTNTLTAGQYSGLRKAVGWPVIEDTLAQKGLEHTAFLTVAEDGGKPVGMARVVSDYGAVILIVDVIVMPEYQGNGIGRELMTRVMEYISQGTSPGQSKMLNLMAAKGKDGFYEKFGFMARPNEKFGPGMTQWISKEARP